MMTPDKKTKKKNILTAVAILAFMVFLFVFTLYNVEFLIDRYDEEKNFNSYTTCWNILLNAWPVFRRCTTL